MDVFAAPKDNKNNNSIPAFFLLDSRLYYIVLFISDTLRGITKCCEIANYIRSYLKVICNMHAISVQFQCITYDNCFEVSGFIFNHKTTQLLASLDVTVDINIQRRSTRLCDVSNFRNDDEKETSNIKMVLKKQWNISIQSTNILMTSNNSYIGRFMIKE